MERQVEETSEVLKHYFCTYKNRLYNTALQIPPNFTFRFLYE